MPSLSPPAARPGPVPGQNGRRHAPRLEVLDGLRLLAAMAVVLFHFVAVTQNPAEPKRADFPGLFPVAVYGWLGVELFFVISGFVICMSAWGRPLGDFFVSRVARLYPAYWVAIAVTTCVLVVTDSPRPDASRILVNLTMLERPLGVLEVSQVYWTLWVELHFYLLFALVVWRGLNYRRVVGFCLVWTAASVLAVGTGIPELDVIVGAEYSMYFVAGIAMYLMHRYGQSLLLWGIVGTSWALALHHVSDWVRLRSLQTDGAVDWRGTAAVITVIFLLMLAVALGKLSWIRGRWLTVAGALTYPLYLIHWEAGIVTFSRLERWIPSHWGRLAAVIAMSLVAAWLLHRLVERPLQPFLDRKSVV